MYDPNKPLTVIRQTSNPQVDVVANPMYVPPEPVVTPTVTTPSFGMTVGDALNNTQYKQYWQDSNTYNTIRNTAPSQLNTLASAPMIPVLNQSPVYASNQAVIPNEEIAPTAYPTTVGEQIGMFKGMRQAYIRGGVKGASQFARERAAENVGEAVGTTKANFKAQSFGEKFNTIGSTIGSIMNALNARKQLKLSRQVLGHQMAMDNKNYEMSRKQWNHVLEDKARYRQLVDKDQGRSYETVGEVMAKYGA